MAGASHVQVWHHVSTRPGVTEGAFTCTPTPHSRWSCPPRCPAHCTAQPSSCFVGCSFLLLPAGSLSPCKSSTFQDPAAHHAAAFPTIHPCVPSQAVFSLSGGQTSTDSDRLAPYSVTTIFSSQAPTVAPSSPKPDRASRRCVYNTCFWDPRGSRPSAAV